MSVQKKTGYPKAGPKAGKLIRSVLALLKSQGISLPLNSHILIAVSGGPDSVALAHLLVHFGRRVVPRNQIELLHVNHGWRAGESDQDELFVQELGRKWNVPVFVGRLDPSLKPKRSSWEQDARVRRKAIFQARASQTEARVMTAHQADDLAETLLWRLCTGAAQTHGGGIVLEQGVELRPFLTTRKQMIYDYLNEVGQEYRVDSTNFSTSFLRARMRRELMPALESCFPKAVDHLVQLALSAQQNVKDLSFHSDPKRGSKLSIQPVDPYGILIQAAGLQIRRSHLDLLSQKRQIDPPWQGEVHLPGGYRLTSQSSEKWVLEKMESQEGRKKKAEKKNKAIELPGDS
ncbi:MAG: tRNA lysidine(34) synthetase TilS [Bdellovibrionia bacterium]